LRISDGRGRRSESAIRHHQSAIPKEPTMTTDNPSHWRLDRRISLSVLLQLLVLVSLILGSWVNLQRQLDGLQHDVTMLLQSQKDFQRRLELLSERSLSHEYRLRALEKPSDTADEGGSGL
jgi:hypothetical protein